MTEIDDLLGSFRGDQAGPAPDAVETVYARAVRDRAAGRRLTPLWRRPIAVAPAVGVLAAATVCAVLLWPSGGGPSPLERAAAAVAPTGKIVHLRIEVAYENRVAGGDWVEDDLVVGHWWTQFSGERLLRARTFISSGPVTEPPSDEDTTIAVDEAGLVTMTSWVGGEVRQSSELPDGLTVEEITPAGLIRKLLTDGSLEESGRTDEGIVLRGTEKGCGTDYAFSEVLVDDETYLPRRAVSGCVTGTHADDLNRQVWTFTDAETLADTAENRKLLELGDWPVGKEPSEPVAEEIG